MLEKKKPNLCGVLICLWIFLIHFNGFAVQETITTPLVTDINHKYTKTLDYPESFAYILFTGAGVLSVITFITLKHLNRYISDFNLVLLSCIMGFIGYLIVIDYQDRIIEPWRFIVGFGIISVAFPFGRGVTLSLFSKLIGGHNPGMYMGWILAIGAISRIVGPFWAVQSLTIDPKITFGVTAILFLVNIILQLVFRKSLDNHWSVKIAEFEEKRSLNLKDSDPLPYVPMSPVPGSGGVVA